MRTLCIVHVSYPDFWPEIASCLRNVEGPLDLVVTYVDETKGIPEMVRLGLKWLLPLLWPKRFKKMEKIRNNHAEEVG